MSSDTEALAAKLTEADAALTVALRRYYAVKHEYGEAERAKNEAEATVDELRAEAEFGLHIGDIVEWDEPEVKGYIGSWGHPCRPDRPARTVAMVVDRITKIEYRSSTSLTGRLLKKDGTVGTREHEIWHFDPKVHRIRGEHGDDPIP